MATLNVLHEDDNNDNKYNGDNDDDDEDIWTTIAQRFLRNRRANKMAIFINIYINLWPNSINVH